MAPYAISFLWPDDEVVAEEVRWFKHDDQALDEIGRSNHPHAIFVREGGCLVAQMPPWPTEQLP